MITRRPRVSSCRALLLRFFGALTLQAGQTRQVTLQTGEDHVVYCTGTARRWKHIFGRSSPIRPRAKSWAGPHLRELENRRFRCFTAALLPTSQ
jgi:hypothetical protein